MNELFLFKPESYGQRAVSREVGQAIFRHHPPGSHPPEGRLYVGLRYAPASSGAAFRRLSGNVL